jgi:ABC-type transport system involved in resistance to organic solvents, auxiliary component
MKRLNLLLVIFVFFLFSSASHAKNPSELINDIVNEAALILKSTDPVESKIIKLNDIAERSVDISGIGMYALGKHKKSMSEDEKTKYKKLFRSYFLKSFSSRLVDYTDPKINVDSQKKINEKYTIVNSV